MLLSLAGIPLTAGFMGKFYIVAAGVYSHQWLLVIMLVVNSAIGLFYYIRIIAVMVEKFEEKERPTSEVLHPSVYIVSGVAMAMLTILLAWIGIYPDAMMVVIKNLVSLK
jgi:NADH-quinone oxidoreductase subunit N